MPILKSIGPTDCKSCKWQVTCSEASTRFLAKDVFPSIKGRLCLPVLLFKNMFKCDICKSEVWFYIETPKSRPDLKINSPMLTTKVWKRCLKFYNLKYKQKNQFLCDTCMKAALGREFQSEDFRDCPLSSDYIKYKNLDIAIIKGNDKASS